MFIHIITLAMALVVFVACEKKGSNSSSSNNLETQGQENFPPQFQVTGQLAVDPTVTEQEGHVEVEGETLALKDNSNLVIAEGTVQPNGVFSIAINSEGLSLDDSASAGAPTISNSRIVDIEALFLAGKNKSAIGVKRQIVLDPQKLKDNSDLPLGSFNVKKVGAIKGNITLESGEDAAGIDLYVPGTTSIAKTDAHGDFLLGFLPPGTYNLRADRAGYGSLEWENIVVKKEETTSLPASVMKIATGPKILSFELGDESEVTLTPEVFLLVSSEGATKFRISQLSDFRDTIFRVIDTTKDSFLIPFQISGQDGLKNIYLEIADSDGLSVTTSLSVLLDLNAPVLGSLYVQSPSSEKGYANSLTPKLFVESCDDLKRLYVTTDAKEKPKPKDFKQDCGKAKDYGVEISVSSGDGEKTLYIWGLDASDQISATPKVYTLILDTLAPQLSMTPAANAADNRVLSNETVEIGMLTTEQASLHYTFDLSEPTVQSSKLVATPSVPARLVLIGNATLKVIARDAAGNTSAVLRRDFIIDREKPLLGSIRLAGSSTTINTLSVPLILSVQAGSQMRLAESVESFATKSWQTYSATASYTLLDITNGPKTIYVMYRDDAGNLIGENGDYFVNFTLDTTAPDASKITLLYPESPTGAFNTPLAWQSNFVNVESGIKYHVEVFSNASYTGSSLRSMVSTTTSTLVNPPLDSSGTYYWRMRPEDAVGNVSSTWVESGADKKFNVVVFASGLSSKRDLEGSASSDHHFAKTIVPLGSNKIGVVAPKTSVEGQCTDCAAVHVYNTTSWEQEGSYTVSGSPETQFGKKVINCDIDGDNTDEVIVAAPGKTVVSGGITYNQAGGVFVFNASQKSLMATLEPTLTGNPALGYTYCRYWDQSPCQEYGYPSYSSYSPIDYMPYPWNSRLFGSDIACMRKSGKDLLIVGEPGYANPANNQNGYYYYSPSIGKVYTYEYSSGANGGQPTDTMLVGDPSFDSSKGKAYVRDLKSFTSSSYVTTNDGAGFGTSAGYLGADLNSDSVSDFVISAPGQTLSNGVKGSVYLVRGSVGGGSPGTVTHSDATTFINVIDADANVIKTAIGRTAYSGFGNFVLGLPDLDGADANSADAFFFVANTNIHQTASSANPEFFVFSYKRTPGTFAVVYHEEASAGSMLGSFAKMLGDIDSDGVAEVAIACPGCQGRLGYTGQVRIVSSSKFVSDPTHATIQMLFNPDASISHFGTAIEYGDVTGDGISDFIIGADEFSVGDQRNVGAVYIYPILSIQADWLKRSLQGGLETAQLVPESY